MKALIERILALRTIWLNKFDKLNEMPKEKQTYLDGHYSGHINAYTAVLKQIDIVFPNGYKDQEYLEYANEKIEDLNEHNEILSKANKDLSNGIYALNKDIKAIELERDRTEDKYNTLHELLLKATKIGLNK
tara:strand:- start:556 stop:951 length:396 start_codon:yes stop_codon:yes gene_type:complete